MLCIVMQLKKHVQVICEIEKQTKKNLIIFIETIAVEIITIRK